MSIIQNAPVAVRATRTGVRLRTAVLRGFYWSMSGVLLLIVLAGFSRTLYLRPLFDVPQIPTYVYVHGAAMTAWYVLFFVQTSLAVAYKAP